MTSCHRNHRTCKEASRWLWSVPICITITYISDIPDILRWRRRRGRWWRCWYFYTLTCSTIKEPALWAISLWIIWIASTFKNLTDWWRWRRYFVMRQITFDIVVMMLINFNIINSYITIRLFNRTYRYNITINILQIVAYFTFANLLPITVNIHWVIGS